METIPVQMLTGGEGEVKVVSLYVAKRERELITVEISLLIKTNQ